MSAQPARIPTWQQISGITPATEFELSDVDRDKAIGKLIDKVESLARAEIDRAVPDNQRTHLWDPIERICIRLEIARSKLSRYTRELSGMSAHEIADKIAAEKLTDLLTAWITPLIAHFPEQMRENSSRFRRPPESFHIAWREKAMKIVASARRGCSAQRWAAELKFANVQRLRRACMLAHKCTVEELEARIVRQLVQKIHEGLCQEVDVELTKHPAWVSTKDQVPGTHRFLDEWYRKFGRFPVDEAEALVMHQPYRWKDLG